MNNSPHSQAEHPRPAHPHVSSYVSATRAAVSGIVVSTSPALARLADIRARTSALEGEVQAAVDAANSRDDLSAVVQVRGRVEGLRRELMQLQDSCAEFGPEGTRSSEAAGILGNFRPLLIELGKAQAGIPERARARNRSSSVSAGQRVSRA